MSLADGHSEYWKWRGTDTIKHGREFARKFAGPGWQPNTEEGFQDLYSLQRATWGKLGYQPTH